MHKQVLVLGLRITFWLCWGRYFQSQTGRDGEVVATLFEVYRNRVGIQNLLPQTNLWQILPLACDGGIMSQVSMLMLRWPNM